MENDNEIATSGIAHKLDYFSVTLFPEVLEDGGRANIQAVRSMLCQALDLPDTWTLAGTSNRGYAQIFFNDGVDSCTFYATPYSPGQFHSHLELKGAGCDAVGVQRLYALEAAAAEVGVRCRVKRLDFAFDHVSFTPDDLKRCWDGGRTQTRIERNNYISNNDGQTFYCGNNQSFQLCCYNKRGFNRAEVRVYGKDAAQIGQFLLSGRYDEAAIVALGLFGHSITFNEADGSQLQSWSDFRGLADGRGICAARAARLSPRRSADAKVSALHDRLTSLLASVAILAAGLRLPPTLVGEMLSKMQIDDHCRLEVTRIHRLLDSL